MAGSGHHSLSRRAFAAGALALAACGRAPERVEAERAFARGRYVIVDGVPFRPVDLHILEESAAFGRETTAFLKRLAGEVREVEALGPVQAGRSTPARLIGEDGLDLAEALLATGHARVWPRGETEGSLVSYYAREDAAREAGEGLWALPDHAVRGPDADALAQSMDSFQVVRGRVVDTGRSEGRRFLNFGTDWRTDVTAVLDRGVAKDLEVESLRGARVEVRGWVEMVNGPSLWLEDARALRVLDG